MTTTVEDIKARTSELLAEQSYFVTHQVQVGDQLFNQFVNADSTLIELLQKGRSHGEKECMVYEGDRWTYDDFYEKSDAVNYMLQEKMKVEAGSRVAIAMRNYPEWGACFFGAVFSGAMVVPLNSWGKKEELLFGIRDSGCRVLVCDQQRFDLIKDHVGELDVSIVVARNSGELPDAKNIYCLSDELEFAKGKLAPSVSVDTDDSVLMLYTSGSTGTPKGVPLTHRAACQAMMNYFYGGALTVALDGADEDAPEQAANLLCVPLFHGTGLFAGLLVAIAMGFKTVMMYKWDPVEALKLVEQEKITQTNAVPALVQALLSCDRFDEFDTSSLKRVGTGGAASPTTLPQLVRAKLKNPVCGTGWGMTETCVLGVSMGGSSYDLKPSAAGIKSPIIELRITGDSGEVLRNGISGEIECKGVTVFKGYWNNPDATKKTFNGDWLQTGDVGYIDDDGYLFITGRSKDLVIRGGENIYPGEIEDACYAIDGVMEAAVYGVPDDALGEELSLDLFVNKSKSISDDGVRDYLSGKLAGFKVPRYIKIRQEPLPKNVANKIDKLVLRKNWTS